MQTIDETVEEIINLPTGMGIRNDVIQTVKETANNGTPNKYYSFLDSESAQKVLEKLFPPEPPPPTPMEVFEHAFLNNSNYGNSSYATTIVELFPPSKFNSVDEWYQAMKENGFENELIPHHIMKSCEVAEIDCPEYIRAKFLR